MSKALSSWQKMLNQLLKDKQLRKTIGWLLAIAIAAFLWYLNWKLFLATTMGIGLMSLSYLLQNYYWQHYCRKWQSFLVGSNRQLILAVGSGAIGSFCTYLAVSVWADAENQWLATGAILQGFASLTTLSVLLWSLGKRRDNTKENKLDNLLINLTDSDSLKRLVAIRQLTRLLISNRLTSDHYAQSIEYFSLMLSEPQLPIVKNALLESLELLDSKEIAKLKSQQVKIPINLQHSHKSVKALQD
ncbi:ATP synthase subunit I [Waterburya agarophytonicola K14]|uniref:ATP synthase subunit I n=1 Tax=Waterburya agarophytonicola KI4 TaxID=2874699 RepID=A0A964BNL9_9CYAN|nr:ATP synthase subunit I [Waterburya agarophytonicola]MCC0176017.1 ATP synthase subunit I [Waterburya agarophytonicola KI4]